jgi:hypothetical protein
MITLNRAILLEKLKHGDPNKEIKLILKQRAVELANYLVDSELVEEYYALSEFTLDFVFFSHLLGNKFIDCKFSEQLVKDLNFTRIDAPDSVGEYCYNTLYHKIFTPIIHGYHNYDSNSVYYFSLRNKLLNLDVLEYDLDNWADEYTIIKFTLNKSNEYINVVFSANDSTINLFKNKYKDYIHYTNRPHRQDYYEEVLRALGNRDINTYKSDSFMEPWLSTGSLDYEREVLRTKNWIDYFNSCHSNLMKNVEPFIDKISITEEEFFDSFFWATIPESYTHKYKGSLK